MSAATTTNDMDVHTITSRVTNPPLELEVTDKAFQPNPTTVRFSRAIQIKEGELVFDIGTGVGPLALMSAKKGAGKVIGVDPVDLHVELAKQNVAKYQLENTVEIYQGKFFEPFEKNQKLKDLRADVIIGDVSGIATAVSHALGWYSDKVPTGGEDGAQTIIEFLKQAPKYLKKEGRIYFPIATDLSDDKKILDTIHEIYGESGNALKKPYVEFPLTNEQIQQITDAYNGKLPEFITIQQGARPYWRGQIWVASEPNS